MVQGVTAVLIREDGKVLLQQRGDGDGKPIPYPNMWCLPGGASEEGESPLVCLVREVKEEFEITLDPAKCFLITNYMHDMVDRDYLFICRVPQNVKPILHEGRDMKWLDFEEIKSFPLAFHQEEIISIIEKHLQSGSNIVPATGSASRRRRQGGVN